MREQRVFLQFLQSDSGVVVVHSFPQKQNVSEAIVPTPCRAEKIIVRTKPAYQMIQGDFRRPPRV
jgi:hypothetical protein